MTGHVYKKKRPSGGEENEERVIMQQEGDASSSVTSCESATENGGGRIIECAIIPGGRGAALRPTLDAVVSSNKFQVVVVSLVIVNCLVVIVELLINLRIFEMGGEQDRTAAEILHRVNIAILGLFVLEMAAKMVAWGGHRFVVKHRAELFDLVVVLASFTLGLTLRNAHGVSLLILLRLWRVTKILNGIVANVKHEADRRMAKERRSRKALEREVYKLREYCLQQECELQIYRTMLQQAGIPQPTVLRRARAPAAPRTLSVVAEVNERGEALVVPPSQPQPQPDHPLQVVAGDGRSESPPRAESPPSSAATL